MSFPLVVPDRLRSFSGSTASVAMLASAYARNTSESVKQLVEASSVQGLMLAALIREVRTTNGLLEQAIFGLEEINATLLSPSLSDAMERVRRASILIDAELFDDAISQLDRAIANFGTLASPHFYLGACMEAKGDSVRAVEEYRSAVKFAVLENADSAEFEFGLHAAIRILRTPVLHQRLRDFPEVPKLLEASKNGWTRYATRAVDFYGDQEPGVPRDMWTKSVSPRPQFGPIGIFNSHPEFFHSNKARISKIRLLNLLFGIYDQDAHRVASGLIHDPIIGLIELSGALETQRATLEFADKASDIAIQKFYGLFQEVYIHRMKNLFGSWNFEVKEWRRDRFSPHVRVQSFPLGATNLSRDIQEALMRRFDREKQLACADLETLLAKKYVGVAGLMDLIGDQEIRCKSLLWYRRLTDSNASWLFENRKVRRHYELSMKDAKIKDRDFNYCVPFRLSPFGNGGIEGERDYWKSQYWMTAEERQDSFLSFERTTSGPIPDNDILKFWGLAQPLR